MSSEVLTFMFFIRNRETQYDLLSDWGYFFFFLSSPDSVRRCSFAVVLRHFLFRTNDTQSNECCRIRDASRNWVYKYWNVAGCALVGYLAATVSTVNRECFCTNSIRTHFMHTVANCVLKRVKREQTPFFLYFAVGSLPLFFTCENCVALSTQCCVWLTRVVCVLFISFLVTVLRTTGDDDGATTTTKQTTSVLK